MQKVIYSNQGGLGVILTAGEQESDLFKDKTFVVNGLAIRPGDTTDLFGLFNKPVRYVGVLRDDETCMVFHLGMESDIFGEIAYYNCFYWIAESRLATKYAEHTVRDFKWIGGSWK